MQKNRLTERLRSLRFTSLVLRSSSTILPEKRRCRIYSGWLFSSETVKPRQRWPKLRLMRPTTTKGGAIPKTLWVRVPTAPTLDWVCMTWSSTKRDLFKGGSFFLLIKRPPLKQPRDFHPGGQLTFWRTFSGLDKGSLIASGERFFFDHAESRPLGPIAHNTKNKGRRKKLVVAPKKSLSGKTFGFGHLLFSVLVGRPGNAGADVLGSRPAESEFRETKSVTKLGLRNGF